MLAALACCGWVTPLRAQKGSELGLQALGTAARADFIGVGVQAGWRPGGRARFVGSAIPGSFDGRFAVRGELLGHFLLNPASLRKGVYAGGGLAGVAGQGGEKGYIVLTIGIESRPGGRSGWSVETGIGGGFRVSAAYRWRKLQR